MQKFSSKAIALYESKSDKLVISILPYFIVNGNEKAIQLKLRNYFDHKLYNFEG